MIAFVCIYLDRYMYLNTNESIYRYRCSCMSVSMCSYTCCFTITIMIRKQHQRRNKSNHLAVAQTTLLFICSCVLQNHLCTSWTWTSNTMSTSWFNGASSLWHLNGCWLSSLALFRRFCLEPFLTYVLPAVGGWTSMLHLWFVLQRFRVFPMSQTTGLFLFPFKTTCLFQICRKKVSSLWTCGSAPSLRFQHGSVYDWITLFCNPLSYCVDWLLDPSIENNTVTISILCFALLSRSPRVLFVNYLNEISHCEPFDFHTSNID